MRRPVGMLAIALSILALLYFMVTPERSSLSLNDLKAFKSQALSSTADTAHKDADVQTEAQGTKDPLQLADGVLLGKPIMAKMTNQTARRELGNAGWRLLHTILQQYPEEPTSDDRMALEAFFRVFSRVYPCRECAEHFQQLLADYPPQLSSRKTAVMWGCEAHNKVNRRLGKDEFDCAYISDKYDCGCGDEEEGASAGEGSAASITTALPQRGG